MFTRPLTLKDLVDCLSVKFPRAGASNHSISFPVEQLVVVQGHIAKEYLDRLVVSGCCPDGVACSVRRQAWSLMS